MIVGAFLPRCIESEEPEYGRAKYGVDARSVETSEPSYLLDVMCGQRRMSE